MPPAVYCGARIVALECE